MITVEEVMTRNPASLFRFSSLHDARMLMEEKGFRHIPIVDDANQLIGVVSQRNVLAHGISSQHFASSEELAEIEQGTLLADVMSQNVVTVSPTLNIVNAAHAIYRKKLGCLPVINENNELIGIVTDHDFVGITLQLLDMMEQFEP